MATIEKRYRCPACDRCHSSYDEIYDCVRARVSVELWAIGKGGKGIRIGGPCGISYEKAMIEADLSDDINQRKQQIEERLRADPDFCSRYGIYR